MTDFFISYTHKDGDWAEWIAFTLEDAGFTTKIQAWDFRPGSNFVLEMQAAADKAQRTVLVLSPDYLNSKMAAPEWAAAFAKDPQGQELRIVPVMVRQCEPSGLLPTIVQIRLQGLAQDDARRTLLAGIDRKRAKPAGPPKFPGPTSSNPAEFPGNAMKTFNGGSTVLPHLKRKATDHDQRVYAKQAFLEIRAIFQKRLEQAEAESPRVSTDCTEISIIDFSSELFVDGKSKCYCRIHLGRMFGPDSIIYSEDRSSGNSANEILNPVDNDGLALSATMSSFQAYDQSFDLKRMTSQEAAEYLWGTFTRPLAWT